MSYLLKKTLELLVGTDDVVFPSLPKMPSVKIPSFSSKKVRPLRKLSQRELIQLESEIGAKLFGEIPKGHRREFFNLDPQTWIWHEEWTDHVGKRRSTTTRYEIHDNGILKAQEGARYSFLEGQELENFVVATRLYFEAVAREIYKADPHTGQPLAFSQAA